MQVAEIISSVVGADVPVRVIGYDGSKAGPDSSELALRINSPRALARLATAPGTLGLARAYVTRRDRGRGRPATSCSPRWPTSRCDDLARAERLRLAPALLPIWLRHRQPPPAAGVPPARAAALQAARLEGDLATTTTCPTASTSGCSGRRWPTPARCYPTATSTLEEAQAAKYELVAQKLALRAGHAAARRRAAAGAAWSCTPRPSTASRRSASRSRATRPSGRRRRSSAGASATWPRCATCDYRDAPESPVRRDQLDRAHRAHRPGQPARRTSRRCSTRLRPEGRLLNHCITQPRTPGRSGSTRSSPATSSRTASWRRSALIIAEMNDAGLRGPPRGEPARALRADPARLGRATSRSTGTRRSPRSASGGPGCGGSTWPPAGSASSATTSSCTRCSACGSRGTAGRGSRCAAGGEHPGPRRAAPSRARPPVRAPVELAGALAGRRAGAHGRRVRAADRARRGTATCTRSSGCPTRTGQGCCRCRRRSWMRCGGARGQRGRPGADPRGGRCDGPVLHRGVPVEHRARRPPRRGHLDRRRRPVGAGVAVAVRRRGARRRRPGTGEHLSGVGIKRHDASATSSRSSPVRRRRAAGSAGGWWRRPPAACSTRARCRPTCTPSTTTRSAHLATAAGFPDLGWAVYGTG